VTSALLTIAGLALAVTVVYLYGRAQYRRGKSDEARKAYERAAQIAKEANQIMDDVRLSDAAALRDELRHKPGH